MAEISPSSDGQSAVSSAESLESIVEKAEWLIQLGRLGQASLFLEPVLRKVFLWSNPVWIKGVSFLIRIFLETENRAGLERWSQWIESYGQSQSRLPARLCYILGLAAFYQRQLDVSWQWAEKALSEALESQNLEDLAYALYLMAVHLRTQGKTQEALRELYNIQVIWNQISNPELRVSVLILNAIILRDVGQVSAALDVLWQAYEELKNLKSVLIPAQLMGLMALCHRDLGNTALAQHLLRLAVQMTDEINTPVLHRQLKQQYLSLQEGSTSPAYDLVFDENAHAVWERSKGRIEFKNQWVLMDLLRLFLQNPGKVYSKEELVNLVWKEKYNPAVHDNKIYVTIKRLRQMIESDPDRPQYIFRARGGYFLNPEVRIMWQNQQKQILQEIQHD